MKNLAEFLRARPLTKSIPDAVGSGVGIERIQRAAAKLGYTRAAVNHALRKAGRPQRPARKPKPVT